MLAYSKRRNKPICPKPGMLKPLNQQETLERSKLQKSVQGSSPSEGGSCSSETQHSIRTVPISKLFVSMRRLQEQRPQPKKLCWVRAPVKIVSIVQKISRIEKWSQDQSRLSWWGDYRNKSHNSEKLSWVRVPMKMVSLPQKLSTMEERHQDQSCLFQQGDYKNKSHNP
jgi:hypothetical protein